MCIWGAPPTRVCSACVSGSPFISSHHWVTSWKALTPGHSRHEALGMGLELELGVWGPGASSPRPTTSVQNSSSCWGQTDGGSDRQ